MYKLKQIFTGGERPVVQPLMAAAPDDANTSPRGLFEVLVRHLFERLLRNESLGVGEETATRITQMAYAVALPGVIVALFLDPLYHEALPREYWAQISDHFFYVTYSIIVMGLGTVLQWDLLFPDQLDAFILTSLPIPRIKLLLARVTALAIFFGCILIGANLLGVIAFPMLAELHGMGLRHTGSHAVAIFAAGLFVSAFLVALQGIFICVLGQRITRRLAPLVQSLFVLLMLTVFFLGPLLSRFLEAILRSGSLAARLFPPFWFLGLYERLLHGNSDLPIFNSLAHTALVVTSSTIIIALITYPLAYARRMRQVIEGTGIRSYRPLWKPFGSLLHGTLLRDPRRRAIYQFLSQTLWRTQRLRLLLAFFGGIGLAIATAGVLLIRVGHKSLAFELSPDGVRMALPVMAFWTVAGLRTAVRATVGETSGWVFRVIHGRPKLDHLRAVELWVTIATCTVTLTTAMVLHKLAPIELRTVRFILVQVFIAIAISILLTDLMFFRERTIPFTEARPYSVSNLAFVVITYLVLFPVFASILVKVEPWVEAKTTRLIAVTAIAITVHYLLRRLKAWSIKEETAILDMPEELLVPGELGLRN